jgi:hypothetical protein
MGSTTSEQTTTTTVPGAGAQETGLADLLTRLATGGMGQLGDLSKLAAGEVGSPTGADQALVNASIERARQMAQREMESYSGELGAQLSEQMAARGMEGSSSEVVARGLMGKNMQNQLAQALLAAQQQGGEALMNLPFQRAQVQLNANQALFNRIVGGAQPVYGGLLQERLARSTSTTTTKQPWDPSQVAELAKMAAGVALAPATGGASLMLMAGSSSMGPKLWGKGKGE